MILLRREMQVMVVNNTLISMDVAWTWSFGKYIVLVLIQKMSIFYIPTDRQYRLMILFNPIYIVVFGHKPYHYQPP